MPVTDRHDGRRSRVRARSAAASRSHAIRSRSTCAATGAGSSARSACSGSTGGSRTRSFQFTTEGVIAGEALELPERVVSVNVVEPLADGAELAVRFTDEGGIARRGRLRITPARRRDGPPRARARRRAAARRGRLGRPRRRALRRARRAPQPARRALRPRDPARRRPPLHRSGLPR